MLSDRQKFAAQPAANNKAPAPDIRDGVLSSLKIKNLLKFLIQGQAKHQRQLCRRRELPYFTCNPGLTKIPDTSRPAEARHAARSKRDSAALRPPQRLVILPEHSFLIPKQGTVKLLLIGEASQHFKLFRYSFCSALMR